MERDEKEERKNHYVLVRVNVPSCRHRQAGTDRQIDKERQWEMGRKRERGREQQRGIE